MMVCGYRRVFHENFFDTTAMEMFIFFFSAEDAPDSDRKDLLSELELMKKLKPHPHVIKLIGCVTRNGK